MIYNAVVHGERLDLDSPLTTPQERALQTRAVLAIAEYQLVKSGVSSYPQLGYRLPEGAPPAVKLLEFLVIERAYRTAERERERRRWQALKRR